MRAPEVRSDDLIRGKFGGYMRGVASICSVRAAVDLGLFGFTRESITAEDLSEKLSADRDLTEMLCDTLAQLELLRKEGSGYVNTAASSLYLDKDSQYYQGSNLEGLFNRLDEWTQLEARLKNGPVYHPRDQVFGQRWLKAIGESCMGGGVGAVVDEIDRHVNLDDYGTFLDLGGGHGLYTIGICHRHPGLKAFVFDLPMMRDIAETNFKRYGKDIGFIAGDFYKDDLGGPYDVVFSSFNLSTSDIRMCDKVAGAVRKGGLLILRRHLPSTSTDSISNLEWSLSTWDGKGKKNYPGSWLPTSAEYMDRLAELGMETIFREDFDKGSELVILRRPS